MKTVNIHEAKTHLSRLVEDAAKGEAFVIAKAGKPLVKVVPLEETPKKKRRIGFLDGNSRFPRISTRCLPRKSKRCFTANTNEVSSRRPSPGMACRAF
jgi:prevent-host-death family protein